MVVSCTKPMIYECNFGNNSKHLLKMRSCSAFWGWVMASSPNIGFLVPFFCSAIWISFHLSLLHCTCLQMPFFTHRLDVLIDMTLFQNFFNQKLNILHNFLSQNYLNKITHNTWIIAFFGKFMRKVNFLFYLI